MQTISKVTINKPVAEVWRFIDNPDNLTKWLTGFIKFEPISGVLGTVGAKAKHIYEMNGKRFEMIEEITSRVENKEFSGVLTHAMMVSKIKMLFKEAGNNSTEVESSADTTLKSFGMRVMSFLIKRSFQKRQDEDLKRLKEVIESGN